MLMVHRYRPENFPLLEFGLGVKLVKEKRGAGVFLCHEYSVEVRVYDKLGYGGDYKFLAVTCGLDVELIEGALARGVSPIEELFLGQGEFRDGLVRKDAMLMAYYADIEKRLLSAGLDGAGGAVVSRSKSV